MESVYEKAKEDYGKYMDEMGKLKAKLEALKAHGREHIYGDSEKGKHEIVLLREQLKERDKAIEVLRQTVMEVHHAQSRGPDWYTRGASGLFSQVRMSLEKSKEALKIMDQTLKDQ